MYPLRSISSLPAVVCGLALVILLAACDRLPLPFRPTASPIPAALPPRAARPPVPTPVPTAPGSALANYGREGQILLQRPWQNGQLVLRTAAAPADLRAQISTTQENLLLLSQVTRVPEGWAGRDLAGGLASEREPYASIAFAPLTGPKALVVYGEVYEPQVAGIAVRLKDGRRLDAQPEGPAGQRAYLLAQEEISLDDVAEVQVLGAQGQVLRNLPVGRR